MDSRDQKSGDSPDKLTYEKMTDDLAALLDHLKTGPVDVLGWSDGGIEALLLGIPHPAKVKKDLMLRARGVPPSSNFIHNLQHIVHDHIVSVLRRKYSFDHFHRFTVSFLTSSNGGLVFVNSDKNPVFKHIDVVLARKLIWIYPPIHMMAPCDNPRPNWYVFRISFENVVRPVTMAIPECAHGVV